MATTYTKLKSGDWGVRSTSVISAGQTVTVSTKAGETKRETIERVLWSGNGVWIAAIMAKARSGGCACSCDECARRCRCEDHCVCRGGNVYDCD